MPVYYTAPLMNLLLLPSLPSLALCFQPRSTFCLTARAHLNTQKYGTGCFAVCYMYLQDVQLKTSMTRTSPPTRTRFSFSWSKFYWNLPRYLELSATSNCISFPFRVQVTGVPLYFKRQAPIWLVWNVDDLYYGLLFSEFEKPLNLSWPSQRNHSFGV